MQRIFDMRKKKIEDAIKIFLAIKDAWDSYESFQEKRSISAFRRIAHPLSRETSSSLNDPLISFKNDHLYIDLELDLAFENITQFRTAFRGLGFDDLVANSNIRQYVGYPDWHEAIRLLLTHPIDYVKSLDLSGNSIKDYHELPMGNGIIKIEQNNIYDFTGFHKHCKHIYKLYIDSDTFLAEYGTKGITCILRAATTGCAGIEETGASAVFNKPHALAGHTAFLILQKYVGKISYAKGVGQFKERYSEIMTNFASELIDEDLEYLL
jgi:hypothetical protein